MRPEVRGKFLHVGDSKLYVRGVTYGTFRPVEGGEAYPDRRTVETDFAAMAEAGINAVRTYAVPPRWLLDAAAAHGLRLMVGLPWEQHVAFLDDRGRDRSIEERVRAGVRACAGHPAVLCYAIGNEIPAPIVRWHGRRRIEAFLERLYKAAKSEDPEGLVTYVSFPTTEYLQLPFLDLVCFNVFLEDQERLDSYLGRLQNIADDRPLIVTELGLDSRRHGETAQALSLDWQIRTAFASGCAGAFVFAWTDEWHRGDQDIEDWDFGLTDRERNPKPALDSVRRAFSELPFPSGLSWPMVSVIVCSHNGAETLSDCLGGLAKLRYPSYEVIVVNDGSTDETPDIAARYGARLIDTENGGLSRARNIGLSAATGEIVAYLDDDACPDPDWLSYLAHSFITRNDAAYGGPNIPPAEDGPVAECVANAPGGPTHVLLSDREAEHIPGCNAAFRRSALDALGGFDPRFRAAGDDVDICWRMRERGWTLGFNPAAMVWHRRRRSVRGYLRQQRGYGQAEALLERKWPEKYSAGGHVTWRGRLYGNGFSRKSSRRRWHVYYGKWGTGLFQSIYEPPGRASGLMPLMPEWYLLILVLSLLSAVGLLWEPLLLTLPLLGVAAGAALVQGAMSGLKAQFANRRRQPVHLVGMRLLTAALYLLQPLARLRGRLGSGLTPWRRRGPRHFALPRRLTRATWSERWKAPEERLHKLETAVRGRGAGVLSGGDYDRWDLEVQGGPIGAVRMREAVEEHGGGRQLTRFRAWPRVAGWALALTALFVGLVVAAAASGAPAAAAVLGLMAGGLVTRTLEECGAAMAALLDAIDELQEMPVNGADGW
jgi:O-antigen biosynthesis protein